MNLTYPDIIVWRRSLHNFTDPYQAFGKRLASDIRRSFRKLEKSTYRFEIEKIDAAYLDRFIPLYESFIQSKRHGYVYDVRGTVKNSDTKYFEAISFFVGNRYLGGLIYTITKKNVSTYYKVLPHAIPLNLRANVSFLAEYILYKRAMELGRIDIVHGTDRNVFGQHSEIGVAMFKIQAGNSPSIPKKLPVQFLNEYIFSGSHDVLIFLGNKKGSPIAKAVLFIADPSQDYRKRYNILFKQEKFFLEVILGKQKFSN